MKHFAIGLLFSCACVFADSPADNKAENVRPVPPPGVQILEADRAEMERGAKSLAEVITRLQSRTNPVVRRHLPEVEVFRKALRYALDYNEVYDATNDVKAAREIVQEGLRRAGELEQGTAPWTTATGLVVRAYVSRIDGSVQPYGLVVPSSYSPNTPVKFRLDTWYHGRDEKLTELRFIRDRMRDKGQFVPENAFVLHLYGRYCNANKFAGEIDLLEALAHVQQQYPIDSNRLVNRGFSMGGAAAWQFSVHYPTLWAASAPGAGFAETPDFLRVFQNESLQPPDYERALWRLYDCTEYALNLFNVPTVAYSGETDKQKQAADIMAQAMAKEGLELTHVIGPKTGHSYHPDAKREINARIDSIVAQGRDPLPRSVKFTTSTLRYNQSYWVTIEGLGEHWKRADVHATIAGSSLIEVSTTNVTALTLHMPSGLCPLNATSQPLIRIDGSSVQGPRVQSDRSWGARLARTEAGWRITNETARGLRKEHGLQGAIDDAFMDSFIFVRPTAPGFHAATDKWAKAELERAIQHWRKQFRGDARVINDTDLTPELMQDNNVVLWGDPGSNKALAHLLPALPAQWTAETLQLGNDRFDSKNHVPILIYPNPKAPKRYVVLNSGFTFRDYDYLNNARQVPKLPDYAIVDVTQPPSSRAPGRIALAGFFNEEWKLK